MRQQPDDFPDHIETTVGHLVAGDAEAARKAIAPIAFSPQAFGPRKSLSRRLRCDVFVRDGFRCRYCGGKTILTPVMELLALQFPDAFPFESHGWAGGVTHPAFAARSPMVDHIIPVALGGAQADPDNLVTACNPCNAVKAEFTLDQLGWSVTEISADRWDGLASSYRSLWEAVGRPNPSRHEAWLRDLEAAAEDRVFG